MTNRETDSKEKIYQAVLDLLNNGEDATLITTRQIAAKAGVNQALVNYYYQSKENLLSDVVGKMMDEIITAILTDQGDMDAKSSLINILKSTADAAFAHEKICRIAIFAELKQGCKNSCAMVTPLLKSILPMTSQYELSIAALQLMLPFHHIVLEPELYGALLGTDFRNKQKRDSLIEQMIDCIITKGVSI